MPEHNPKVFISYSHDSEEHKDRVLALSDRLRADGIDCSIDQYETSPPEGWARWCDRQIEEADFVLVVCTENTEKHYNEVTQGTIVRCLKFSSCLLEVMQNDYN